MSRRVLLITYYFPPSGGPGVQRALKFVKYLPGFGWRPSVLTVSAGAFPERDATLADDVPEGVQVHRTRALEPFRWYNRFVSSDDEKAVVGSVQDQHTDWKKQLALWVRANVFLPDARVGWVPFAVRKGLWLLRNEPFDAVLTSGPPHSVHLTGRLLRAVTGVPWIADFRDPWTDINYYEELPHTRWARRLDRAMERSVLRSASVVTTVSPTWKRRLMNKSSGSGAHFDVIHNGFDDDDFTTEEPLPSGEHFVISYVGSLYASRNPEVFWQALRRLRRDQAIPKLRVRLIGRVDSVVEESIEAHGLSESVEHVPYVPHREAVRLMQESALLLLVIEDFSAAEGMITGKLYEYLASGRPVLGIGPPGGDAARLLRNTQGGQLFGHADTDEVARFIRHQYASWETGRMPVGTDRESIASYSRKAQTETLAHLLDILC